MDDAASTHINRTERVCGMIPSHDIGFDATNDVSGSLALPQDLAVGLVVGERGETHQTFAGDL